MSNRTVVPAIILSIVLFVALSLAACTAPATTPTSTPARASTAPTALAGIATTPTSAPAAPTSTPAPKPRYGGTLKWATNQESTGMDTAGPSGRLYTPGNGRAMREIYNGLIQYEPDTQKLLPELAIEWAVSPDGREITFKLRPNVKFHDGTPFNAEAVKFHFERMIGVVDPKTVGRFKSNYDRLIRVDVVDELTAKFLMRAPQASLLNYLGDPSGYITSPSAYKKDPDNYSRNPVGTGPMILKEWTKDTKLVLTKNPSYWERDKDGNQYPYLDGIIMTPITDTAVQIANVRTGTMDYAEEIPPQEVAKVRADANLVYYENPSFGAEIIGLRQNKPPFDSRACREAFLGSIDKEAISRSVYFSVSKPAETIISPASAYYDPNTKGIPFDLERARQKLRECGKPDGFEAEIYTLSIPRIVSLMEAIQAQEAKIGIKVNVLVRDSTGVSGEYAVQKKGNAWAIYSPSYSDPLTFLGNFQCDNPGNHQGLCYPELEKLYDEAESAFDFNKRKAVLQEIAKFSAHSPWSSPIVFNPENALALKKVKGIRMAPQSLQHFKWVWLE